VELNISYTILLTTTESGMIKKYPDRQVTLMD